MNIHEYQAKEMFRKFGIPVLKGNPVLSRSDINKAVEELDTDLYVVKAQVHAGGRGKGGGIKKATNKEEARQLANDMIDTELITKQTGSKGHLIKRLYIESGCNIEKEYYLSLVVDRKNQCFTFIASSEGGVNIEEVAETNPEKIIKVKVDPLIGLQSFQCRQIAFGLGFQGDVYKQAITLLQSIYNAFVNLDASQIEINPLVTTKEGKLIALDAKMSFDDNALFKHPEILEMQDRGEENELEVRASQAGLNYIKMEGNIGCMVNGAGLAMATMDIIKLYGGEPANFLDVGGTADEERVSEALKIILSDRNVQAVLINIFGGIVRCDVIAGGIINAAKNIGIKVPLIVRLAGTNFEKGNSMLASSGLNIIAVDDLGFAAEKVVSVIK